MSDESNNTPDESSSDDEHVDVDTDLDTDTDGDGDGGDVAAEQVAAPDPSPVDQGPTPWPADKEKNGYIWGTGRRKSSVARVRMRPGTGQLTVNDQPFSAYFTSNKGRGVAVSALNDTKRLEHYDIFVRASGGGNVGQAGAVLLGIARCLKLAEPLLEATLRENGHLTRDSRQKERKKYGRRGARRGFQFSKR